MNILENYIVEIYSEKEITHKELGKMIEVSMKSNCYGQEAVNKHWFEPQEWEQIKKQGYFLG